MGALESVGDPLGAFLILGATVCTLAAMYVVCYTFFMAHWEGWEAWHRRTGLDADKAADEALRRK